MLDMEQIGLQARTASRVLIQVSMDQKNRALDTIADVLLAYTDAILQANEKDIEEGRVAGLSDALLDRMLLTKSRLAHIAEDVRNVMQLPDPTGEVYDATILPNGLHMHKRRTPFGVIGVVYEARPNVTVDVATLCLKSGNAAILRGGKEIKHSCAILGTVLQEALQSAGVPSHAIQVIDDPDRALVEKLLRLDTYVDVIIPRGGAGLHQFCREHATIPVITGGIGVCHIYVDQAADLNMVVPIVHNAKVQRPSVCNALDTLLVHRAVAATTLPAVAEELLISDVELRGDEESLALLQAAGIHNKHVVPAQADDFGTEFLALVLSIRVVDSLEMALEHIAQYSTGHSEAILTKDRESAEMFVRSVDSSVVLVNASTRFNDGAQMGMGAEIAISTQKLHVRGPMALRELTTYKWVIEGNGHVRP
ncbi:MAG: glutamate-5-semialdehyde dehydrogenase [Chloroflexi bacterium AL-N1]|nr:glutamate-5-semialdehyde dehydrogenase [Chloroflexi bacterium AL-N1]